MRGQGRWLGCVKSQKTHGTRQGQGLKAPSHFATKVLLILKAFRTLGPKAFRLIIIQALSCKQACQPDTLSGLKICRVAAFQCCRMQSLYALKTYRAEELQACGPCRIRPADSPTHHVLTESIQWGRGPWRRCLRDLGISGL